jgi:FMN-dependent NADH-azoreductase
MSTLLHLDSSAKSQTSTTKKVTAYFAEKWQAATKGSVVERDLGKSQIRFLDEATIGSFWAQEPNEEQRSLLAQSNELIQELVNSDVYVLGVPMYNFGVPGIFKSYIDLITRPHRTFTFVDGAPKGLLTNKKAYVITASGQDFSSGPLQSWNFVEPYTRLILGFVGVSDVTFISITGRDPASVEAGIETAKARIDEIFAPVLAH